MTVLVALAVAWWLFADTIRRHSGRSPSESEMRFAHFGSFEDYEFWQSVIADFERDHPGVTVIHEYIVGLGDQYNVKLRQQVLSRTLPDVALIQLLPFHELADHFEDLGPLAKDGAFSDSLDPIGRSAFRANGVQRGLPFSGGNLLIFANRRCFERAARFHGTPVPLPSDDWTITDFLRTAEMLTCDFDRDGRTDQFGFWLPRWIYFLPFIWSFGGQPTNADATQWTLTGPAAESALRFYRQLSTGDRVSPRDEEVPQLIQDTGFLSDRAAMCVNGPWFMPFLDKTDLKDAYIIAPIPVGPAGRATRMTWDGVVMASDLPPARKTLARKFMDWVLSREVQDRLARLGRGLPARRESLAEFTRPDPARRRHFVEALPHSRLQPILPNFDALDRIINRHFNNAADPTLPFRADQLLESLANHRELIRAFGETKEDDN